jgi:hypothetical protein
LNENAGPAFQCSRDDEYRAKAEEAKREADRSTSELDCAAWLRIVEGFLNLIRKPRRREGDE